MWLIVGNPDGEAAVGIEFPDNLPDVHACRRIVADWTAKHGLGPIVTPVA